MTDLKKKFQHGRDDDLLKATAKKVNADWQVHLDDLIFNFIINHTGFPDEQTKLDYYFNDAKNSSDQLHKVIEKHNIEKKKSIKLLEFASGYGCVSKQLKNSDFLELTCCDIQPEAIKFLTEELGVKAIKSNSQPELLKLSDDFDVVFALSFFSHLPITTWNRWLVNLIRSVKKGGLIIFTAQGIKSLPFFGNPEVGELGFYFLSDNEQCDPSLEEYGHTIAFPEFVQKTILTIPQVKEIEFREGYWWGHQDLYVLKKVADI